MKKKTTHMALTLCGGINCPHKFTCSRYRPEIYEGEPVFTHTPYNPVKKKCEFYMGIEENALMEHIKSILGNGNKGSE